MELKHFHKLSAGLAGSVDRFIAQNFYALGKRTPKILAEEEEKFFSQPRAWLVAFDEDEIIGITALHQRRIRFESQDIILGGVGRVCTRRDKRRQGIAASMLKKAVGTLKKWGCDIAFLCANVKESGALYSKAGFVPLGRSYTYTGRSGRLYEETNGMVAPIKSPGLFEEILSSKDKLHLGHGNW